MFSINSLTGFSFITRNAWLSYRQPTIPRYTKDSNIPGSIEVSMYLKTAFNTLKINIPGEDTMEYFVSENITPDIENVLRRLKIEGNTVKITEQLDRKLYEGVNEVLERLGGKWNRSAKVHVFSSDPTERINAVLTAGKIEPKIKTGYFPTPPELARRMVAMLDLKPGDKVLEPSAGQGGLLDQLPKGYDVVIGEILPENIQVLKQKGYTVNFDNFLGVEIGGITKVIMNPPFELQADVEHVTHALKMLQPGGTLVSVMAPGIKFRDNKKTTGFIEMLDRDYYHEIIDLPAGSFKESGTGVNAVLLKVTKPTSTPSTVSSGFVADTTKVNPELAARSHMGTSWDPEKRAEQEIAGFGQYVQEVYDNLKKAAHSERQTAFVESEIKTFQDRFAKYYNDLLARKGRTMSTFITGGSNFNVRRADKANDAERAKYEEMIEFRDRAVAAIMRELRKMGIEEQGGELEVLKKKLLNAQRSQEVMKEANAILRKNIPKEDKVKAIMEKTGMAEPSVLRLFEPDYAKRIGYPQFELTNNLANIHRMEQRVKEMEKKEAAPSEDIPFEGGTISDNAEQDRVQINFDKKPEPAMIEKLKSEGWRWSPSNSAWQRKRTDMALRSARRIVGLPENWANPKFLEIKKDPTKEIYDRLRDKAGTEGVNKFEMAIARIIAISDNTPLRQQDTNRLKALVASLSNLSLGELKALDKTIKRWGENLSELKAPLDYVYSELLKKRQAEESQPFISTKPDKLVTIVERSNPSPAQQTITALEPENVPSTIKPNDDIILELYDPIEGWNRYIRTRVGNTEYFVANSTELKNLLGGLGSIYYYDSLYNKQNPITIKHTEYGYFKVLYFLENNYIDPKYIIKSESVAMLPEKQSPPHPFVSTAPDKLVSIVERSKSTQPQTHAVIDLRWVYGTKDMVWHLVGHGDRDYFHGITQERMRQIGQEAARAEYLSPAFTQAIAPIVGYIDHLKRGDKVSWESPTMRGTFIEGYFVGYNADGTVDVEHRLAGFAPYKYTVERSKLKAVPVQQPSPEESTDLNKLIFIIEKYVTEGTTYEDFSTGRTLLYLSKTGVKLDPNNIPSKLKDDLRKAGYNSLSELWNDVSRKLRVKMYVPPKLPLMLYPPPEAPRLPLLLSPAPVPPEVKKYTTPRTFKKGTIARNNITNEKFVLETDVEALQEDKNATIWRTNDQYGHYIYLEDQRPAAIPTAKKPSEISNEDMQLLKTYEKISDYAINQRITLNQGKLKVLAARKLVRIEKGQYGTMGSAYIEQERLGISQEISRLYRIQELRELIATQARPEPWKLTQEEYWRSGAGGKAYEGRGTSDYTHKNQVIMALAQGKTVGGEVLKDYPDIVARIRQENEAILAKERAERERIRAIERTEENELNAELNKLPPALKRFAETEITGTLHLPESHKDYHNRFVIALGKVRRIVLEHQPKTEKKEVPEPSEYFTLKKAQALTKENKLLLSDQQLHEKSIQIQDYIRLIEAMDEYSRKTLIKGGYYAQVVHPDATGMVPVDIWLLQSLKFTLAEFDKERQRRTQEKAQIHIPAAQAVKPVQSIQDIKQQVIQSIHEAKSLGELKQILKGFGFLPLPESEKRQLIDLYQIRFSELTGELTFGQRITEEEKKKRKAPQKVTYVPGTSRRLEEFGIKEGMRRYGYA